MIISSYLRDLGNKQFFNSLIVMKVILSSAKIFVLSMAVASVDGCVLVLYIIYIYPMMPVIGHRISYIVVLSKWEAG